MEEEYLKQIKQNLGSLTFEESMPRDLYLKNLANGTLEGPPVGYSSIDKSWLKYYTDDMISEKVPKVTIYDSLIENNKNHLDEVAFEYFGKKVTYREMIENIDKAAVAYVQMGVKKGNIVTICSIMIQNFYIHCML